MKRMNRFLDIFRSTKLFGAIHNSIAIFKRFPMTDYYMASADKIFVSAYQLYLSNQIPKIYSLQADDRIIFDKVKSDYDASAEFLMNNKTAGMYIGDDWGILANKFRNILCGGDYHKIMATYGARSYKDLSLYEVRNFAPFYYMKQVSDILNIMAYLKENYFCPSLHYEGYSDYFHPYFKFEGNIYNTNRLTDLEMRLFLQKMQLSFKVVAEIGAGDGKCCRELIENHDNLKYVIFDIPEILSRSQLFLTRHFSGKKTVGGYLDFIENGKSLARTLKNVDILCLPCWLADRIDCDIDLWLSMHALGEMPLAVSRRYIDIINNNSKYFVSITDDIDRCFKNLTIKSSTEYLSLLSHMEVVSADYPFSSCFPRIRPYYGRHLFKRRELI